MRKLIRILLIAIPLVLATVAGGAYWLANKPLQLPNDPLEFRITPGSGMRAVARDMASAGLPVHPELMVALARWMRVDTAIKAGSYEIRSEITPVDLLRKLTRGDVTQAEIVFIEGWTFRQMRDKLDAHPDIRHDSKGLPDAEVMRLIGASENAAEGLFFPDTYLFAKQSRDLEVLARAYRTMQRHLKREWEGRDQGLPYNDAYQALIMASIVEKETGRDADRPMIASVFVNRLRLGMLLQTDPTVIYGLGDRFDGNLRKRDLQTDTPYNTYTRSGLTPTPIAMPGLASLRAALHPANSTALYFVARGDGSSQFSRTLDEHNQAVNKYQRSGRR